MSPKISIIVPIYNAERYLEECLAGIARQTLENIEVLCVVNGSTDRSLEIAERFALEDNRFRVIVLEKADLGGARNAGVRASSGDYLMFVDSDDWIIPEACEKLYAIAADNDLDILQAGYLQVPFNFCHFNNAKKRLFYSVMSGFDFITLNQGISFVNWDKLWKRDFFIKSNLYNPEGVFFEDGLTSMKGFLSAGRMMAIPYRFYRYRFVETSITHSRTTPKHLYSYRCLAENTESLIDSSPQDCRRLLLPYYFRFVFIYYSFLGMKEFSAFLRKVKRISSEDVRSFPFKLRISYRFPKLAFIVYPVFRKVLLFRAMVSVKMKKRIRF